MREVDLDLPRISIRQAVEIYRHRGCACGACTSDILACLHDMFQVPRQQLIEAVPEADRGDLISERFGDVKSFERDEP